MAMEIMFEGTIAIVKNAWPQVVKYQRKTPKVLGTLLMAKTFVDPQCESSMDIDPMDVECPLMSRAGLESNKGKCLATNVRL